jgi:hypothetical protein
VNVIGMVVREQNGIHAAYIRCYQLKPQLRRSVDENVRASIRLDERADARPLVPRIRRPAHLAATSNLWNAETCARPQKREFQTVSTLSKLVVPGMSNGTPAVTMIRSPLLASSR